MNGGRAQVPPKPPAYLSQPESLSGGRSGRHGRRVRRHPTPPAAAASGMLMKDCSGKDGRRRSGSSARHRDPRRAEAGGDPGRAVDREASAIDQGWPQPHHALAERGGAIHYAAAAITYPCKWPLINILSTSMPSVPGNR